MPCRDEPCPLCGVAASAEDLDHGNRVDYLCKHCGSVQIDIVSLHKLSVLPREIIDKFIIASKSCGKGSTLVILQNSDGAIVAECCVRDTLRKYE